MKRQPRSKACLHIAYVNRVPLRRASVSPYMRHMCGLIFTMILCRFDIGGDIGAGPSVHVGPRAGASP